MNSFRWAEKTVLVTGGSMGIGEAFARSLHAKGARLVLTARSRDKLERLASELPGTRVVVEDLSTDGGAQRVFDAVQAMGATVDVLINNAGFGTHGRFVELPLEKQRAELRLNVVALVELTYLFLPGIEAGGGGVINVASTAAFQPVPYMAVYAASKGFVLSFSEALWAEYRRRGVRVLALCPGATDTPFFARAGEAAALGKKARPEDVVRAGLVAFERQRPFVIQGWLNYLTSFASRFASRAFTARLSAWLMRPRGALPPSSSAPERATERE